MIVLTQICKRHTNYKIQKDFVKRWDDLGVNVYSFNGKSELDKIINDFPTVNFTIMKKTGMDEYGIPVIYIKDILTKAKKFCDGVVCICNSDLQTVLTKEQLYTLIKYAEDNLVLCNSYQYKDNFSSGIVRTDGWGVFFFHTKIVDLIPESNNAMGIQWWDYWLPYFYLKNVGTVLEVKQSFFYHQEHKRLIGDEFWYKNAEVFKKEIDMETIKTEDIGWMADTLVRDKIKPLEI